MCRHSWQLPEPNCIARMSKQKKLKILFCVNDRGEGSRSCAASGANSLRQYAKQKAADHPTMKIKVKKTSCLGLCKHGPVLEILPAKIYYHCKNEADVDLFFSRQIDLGKPVPALLIRTAKSAKKK